LPLSFPPFLDVKSVSLLETFVSKWIEFIRNKKLPSLNTAKFVPECKEKVNFTVFKSKYGRKNHDKNLIGMRKISNNFIGK
jgi:hypothetical protein